MPSFNEGLSSGVRVCLKTSGGKVKVKAKAKQRRSKGKYDVLEK